MKLITEPEFYPCLKEKLDSLQVGLLAQKINKIKSVMGPGRSGAVASVYASHYLGAIWLPAAMKLIPPVLRPVLVIDTATQNGASLRKLANRVKAEYQLAVFQEPPRVRFWYEEKDAERPELEVISYGGKCAECGFEYREYQGHIIPCPRCELKIKEATEDGDYYYLDTRLPDPGDGSKEKPFNSFELYNAANRKNPRNLYVIFWVGVP